MGGAAYLRKAGAQALDISEVLAMKLMLAKWSTDKQRCCLAKNQLK